MSISSITYEHVQRMIRNGEVEASEIRALLAHPRLSLTNAQVAELSTELEIAEAA